MSDLLFTSKFKTSNIIFYIFGILFISTLCIVICFSKFNPNNLATYSDLAAGCFLAFFPAYILYYTLNLPKILIYSDKIELHRFLGLFKPTFLHNEIDSWTVREKESKYGNYEYLYLALNDNKIIKINSFDYNNFEEIKWKIIKNKPQNSILKEKLDRKEKIKFAIILALSAILFFYISSQFYKDDSLTKNDVCVIKGTLSDDIKIKRGKKSNAIIFKLKDQPDFKFKIGTLAFKETYYEGLKNDFKKGDEIYLTIEKDQYDKKISKKTQMSSWEKYTYYELIAVVEVENNGFKYLSLSDYNKTNRDNDIGGLIFFSICGLVSMIGAIYILRKINQLKT